MVKKNNHQCKEINIEMLKQNKLFGLVIKLEGRIDELETIIDTQKYGIDQLKRNIQRLDMNACQCQDHILSPKPHGLMDEESLKYSMDSLYHKALAKPSNPLLFPLGTPPATTPLSDIEDFTNPTLPFYIPPGQVTGFGCDIANDVVEVVLEEGEDKDVTILPLENLNTIPIMVCPGYTLI